MRTIRLGSDTMVNAAGLFRWAMNGYCFKKDRAVLRRVMKECWDTGLADSEWDKILSGEVSHRIENDTVVIEI